MKFRPCIDIHEGKVKQIVGGSLSEKLKTGESSVSENYVSSADSSYYASLYKSYGLTGGHIILLDKKGTNGYEKDVIQAKEALSVYPGGMQIGGGITCENAEKMLDMGASHIIVTSYVFSNGTINYDNLNSLKYLVGKERLVLDLSCRKKDGAYTVVTDRWQIYTKEEFNLELLDKLNEYCDEFLVHAVDVEGRVNGIESEVVKIMAEYEEAHDIRKKHAGGNRFTYAGGIASYEDIELIDKLSNGKTDFTVGSALDIFGGTLSFEKIAGKIMGLHS